MAIKSSNTQGNPYHNEETGEFTSAGSAGSKKSKSKSKKKKFVKKAKPKPTLKNNTALADLFARLADINQGVSVGPLSTYQEVEDNVEKFFSKQVINHVDFLLGKSTGCQPYQFHPKANPWVSLNIFTCVLGKYRYQDNHAHIISADTFIKMANDPSKRFTPIYRGITSSGERRQNILKSYAIANINNLDIYGNGMYGTNVYTTTKLSYAQGYGNPIMGLIDNEARTIDSVSLERMQRNIDTTNIEQKLNAHLKTQGLDDERANQMAHYFSRAIKNDISLLAICLGYDYQVSDGHQRNLLNLNKWYIRQE